jgi:hypothetical protein
MYNRAAGQLTAGSATAFVFTFSAMRSLQERPSNTLYFENIQIDADFLAILSSLSDSLYFP